MAKRLSAKAPRVPRFAPQLGNGSLPKCRMLPLTEFDGRRPTVCGSKFEITGKCGSEIFTATTLVKAGSRPVGTLDSVKSTERKIGLRSWDIEKAWRKNAELQFPPVQRDAFVPCSRILILFFAQLSANAPPTRPHMTPLRREKHSARSGPAPQGPAYDRHVSWEETGAGASRS